MKIAKHLDVIFKVLITLEALKLAELLVVFSVKKNEAIIPVSIAFFSIFLITRKLKRLGLLSLLISNYILIFNYSIVNQHFAYLTCLLTIFAVRYFLDRFYSNKEEIDRVVALLLIFQLSALYLFAAIWKINLDYFSGMQMLEHLRPFLIFPNEEQPSYAYRLMLSASGIAIELILACQLFLRGKVLEFVQSAGFIFHFLLVFMLGEDLRNSFQIFIFSCAAIAIYPLCNRNNWQDGNYIVFWDSSCSFCSKSVNIFKKFDLTQNYQYLSNTEVANYPDLPFKHNLIDETIVVWDPESNEFWIKSKAVMFILTGSYLFWFLKPVLRFPYVFKLTDKLYDQVAQKRSCNI